MAQHGDCSFVEKTNLSRPAMGLVALSHFQLDSPEGNGRHLSTHGPVARLLRLKPHPEPLGDKRRRRRRIRPVSNSPNSASSPWGPNTRIGITGR